MLDFALHIKPQRIQVYRNLRDRCYSVVSLDRGMRFGQVVEHVTYAHVFMPTFVVQKAGHRKVLLTGQKNVHAFIRGENYHRAIRLTKNPDEFFIVSEITGQTTYVKRIPVTYNPLMRDYFYNPETGDRVDEAVSADLTQTGVFAYVRILSLS